MKLGGLRYLGGHGGSLSPPQAFRFPTSTVHIQRCWFGYGKDTDFYEGLPSNSRGQRPSDIAIPVLLKSPPRNLCLPCFSHLDAHSRTSQTASRGISYWALQGRSITVIPSRPYGGNEADGELGCSKTAKKSSAVPRDPTIHITIMSQTLARSCFEYIVYSPLCSPAERKTTML